MRARVAVALAVGVVLGTHSSGTQARAPSASKVQVPNVHAAPSPDLLLAAQDPPAQDPPAQDLAPPPEAGSGGVAETGSGETGQPGVEPSVPVEEMTQAELLELGLGVDQAAVDTSLRLSGFIDFGMLAGLDSSSRLFLNDQSFYIGNLNLYITKNLTESIRTMAEVRLLYLPNGGNSGGPQGAASAVRGNTTISDYTDFDRTLRWGGIEIERVYLEWSPLPWVTVRAGQFLTPYGVWNVDHGSPTIIPAQKPFVIGVGYFPERQTGIELYGRVEASNDSGLGYHLTVSNGAGPISEWADLDKNKAVGGRAFWEYHGLGELRLGGSAYYGRYTDSIRTTVFGDVIRVVDEIQTQYDTLAVGVDAVWKYAGVHLQGEWLQRQNKYTNEGRTATATPTGTTFPSDTLSWGAYGLLGYRFDWLNVMPFVSYQRLHEPAGLNLNGYHVGLNVRAIDAMALKLQLDTIVIGDTTPIRIMYAQVAWAF
jgi:hypothetical protein